MSVSISNIDVKEGTITTTPNQEVDVISISVTSTAAIIEGYLDLSQAQSGDIFIINEYISFDGANFYLFASFTAAAPIPTPIIRFHSKMLPNAKAYKVTIKQEAGSQRTVRYLFMITELNAT